MGIDIYAEWPHQTKKEKENQYTGFSTIHGHVGYLREAYHGEPYMTHFLLKEAFDSKTAKAKISAETLRKRLPKALKIAEKRENKVYECTDKKMIKEIQKSITDFVELCEEKEKKTGKPCTIIASY